MVPESETEADLEAFAQAISKRKYPGHLESSSKRQKLSVGDDDSLTESDDDGPCMYPRMTLFTSADWSPVSSSLCYRVWPPIYLSLITLISMT